MGDHEEHHDEILSFTEKELDENIIAGQLVFGASSGTVAVIALGSKDLEILEMDPSPVIEFLKKLDGVDPSTIL